ncbi:MAG: hypothetical protein IPM29_00440 [Planctomycetes bacterium]|nr:hypothetical protein [Planctomycetota bacterium]
MFVGRRRHHLVASLLIEGLDVATGRVGISGMRSSPARLALLGSVWSW